MCKQEGVKQCSGCKSVVYCSEKCQASNWSSHQTLCKAIRDLTERGTDGPSNKEANQKTPEIHVNELKGHVYECPPRTKTKVVKLVGQQCVVSCLLNDISVEVLWDTGAQVSLVHSNWLSKFFPGLKLRSVNELTEGGFDIKSACGSEIPILGWIPLKFQLPSKEASDQVPLIVPFLVSDTAGLDRPILGFNVIVEMFSGNLVSSVISQLGCAMIDVPRDKIKVLSDYLSKELSEQICNVKTGKVKNVITPGSFSVLRVSVHSAVTEGSMTALFVPKVESVLPEGIEVHETVVKLKSGSTSHIGVLISNHTNHPVSIPAKTTLGCLETVKSVVEMPVNNVFHVKHRETRGGFFGC